MFFKRNERCLRNILRRQNFWLVGGNTDQKISVTNVAFELSLEKWVRFCLTGGDEEQESQMEGRA